jgi:hypothetical protein
MIFVLAFAAALVILILAGSGVVLVLRRIELQSGAAQSRVEDFRTRQKRAVWGGATIVSVRRAILAEDARGKEKIDLTLQVQPPNGESYSAHATWYADLSALAELVAGASVSIKIDATDPKIIYPNMTGVEYWMWS